MGPPYRKDLPRRSPGRQPVAQQTARALSSVLAVETACGFWPSSQTLPRSTESSAISSRSAVLRQGSYARHCTEIHPQLPRRLLSLEPHRRGLLPTIAARLRVHFFPSLTVQDLAIPVPAPVPSPEVSSMPLLGPPFSRAPVLTQRVLRIGFLLTSSSNAPVPELFSLTSA